VLLAHMGPAAAQPTRRELARWITKGQVTENGDLPRLWPRTAWSPSAWGCSSKPSA